MSSAVEPSPLDPPPDTAAVYLIPRVPPSHPMETSQLSHVLLTTCFLLHEFFSCLDLSQSPACLNNFLPSFSPMVSNL